jgi:hypothetical protein
MRPVEELHHISASLAVWQAYDPSVKVDCTSTALATPQGWLLIDPIPLADACVAELAASRPMAGILLTSGNHQRASLELKARHGLSIYAPDAPDLVADVWISAGQDLGMGFELVSIAGAGPRELTVRFGEVTVFGDAVINLGELALLPDKYCENPKSMRACLKQLIEIPWSVACVAHGWPITGGASAKIQALLE